MRILQSSGCEWDLPGLVWWIMIHHSPDVLHAIKICIRVFGCVYTYVYMSRRCGTEGIKQASKQANQFIESIISVICRYFWHYMHM